MMADEAYQAAKDAYARYVEANGIVNTMIAYEKYQWAYAAYIRIVAM